MEGLRTTLPGVQLVTAFLLTVPLYDKYDHARPLGAGGVLHRLRQRAAGVAAAHGAVVAPAPAVADDGVARRHRRHLDVAVRLTIVGSVLFAVAITAVAFLVSSIVLGTGVVDRRHRRRRAHLRVELVLPAARVVPPRLVAVSSVPYTGAGVGRLGEQVVDHRR